MEVYVVVKTLYGKGLTDDFGNEVNCLSEIVGVYASVETAHQVQDDLYNTSPYNIVPMRQEEFDPNETYIDVVVEEAEVFE